jgi:hypothetical protein
MMEDNVYKGRVSIHPKNALKMDDGNIKTLLLFADIDVQMQWCTFSHPAGLLFATQLVQIVLDITEKAAFKDMCIKGFMQNDCA